MGDPPRFVPPGHMVEVTDRTLHGKFLLCPGRDLNDIVVGILAGAAARYRVGVVAFVTLSNHMQLLLLPDDVRQLARFMEYVNGNVAKEAGRLYRWREKFWGRRYKAIVVSQEPEAQIARLRYILENGCKENLVRRAQDWPGASSTESLLTGKPLRGWWFDLNDRFWLLTAATTDVEYTLTIVDTVTEEEVVVFNALGDPSAAMIDTGAFAGCE